MSLRRSFALAFVMRLPAGITDPGYNGVVNQQKTPRVAKGAATRETNFVLVVVFCSGL